jgi:hypothetical protein
MAAEQVVVQTIGMAAAAMADRAAAAHKRAHQQIRARAQQDKVTIAVHETAMDPALAAVAQAVPVVQPQQAEQVVLVYKPTSLAFLHIMQVAVRVEPAQAVQVVAVM